MIMVSVDEAARLHLPREKVAGDFEGMKKQVQILRDLKKSASGSAALPVSLNAFQPTEPTYSDAAWEGWYTQHPEDRP